MDAEPGHPGASGCGPCVRRLSTPQAPLFEGHPGTERPGEGDWGILPHALFSQDDLECSTVFGDFFFFFNCFSHPRTAGPTADGKFCGGQGE